MMLEQIEQWFWEYSISLDKPMFRCIGNVCMIYIVALRLGFSNCLIGIWPLDAPGMLRYVYVYVYIYNYIYIFILLWFLLLLLLYIIFVSGILFFGYTDSMSGWWCDFLKSISIPFYPYLMMIALQSRLLLEGFNGVFFICDSLKFVCISM